MPIGKGHWKRSVQWGIMGLRLQPLKLGINTMVTGTLPLPFPLPLTSPSSSLYNFHRANNAGNIRPTMKEPI